eukprot:NODE_8222_length_527_cov_17.328452_g7167_i0.p4 GENE.NODE_8222_length_527_cov_17.328452_g7167_i0~~NODE_8222_length_527_cov_17.328452_g7167_i0.p4  ORF type:complete len:57 (+),score=4.12 NODE_8222_length_527_cov_17.328452_g7167_i0:31-171(+)
MARRGLRRALSEQDPFGSCSDRAHRRLLGKLAEACEQASGGLQTWV